VLPNSTDVFHPHRQDAVRDQLRMVCSIVPGAVFLLLVWAAAPVQELGVAPTYRRRQMKNTTEL
jgi:hypothetical protein